MTVRTADDFVRIGVVLGQDRARLAALPTRHQAKREDAILTAPVGDAEDVTTAFRARWQQPDHKST